MNDFMKWALKVVLQMVVWVFILSINWNGRTLFDRFSDVLVHNAIVQEADEQLAELWDRVSRTAKMTFTDSEKDADRKM